jgi:hypothetical protein
LTFECKQIRDRSRDLHMFIDILSKQQIRNRHLYHHSVSQCLISLSQGNKPYSGTVDSRIKMANASISVHVRLRPLAGKDGTLTSANEVLLTDRTASVPSGSKTDSSQRLKFTLDACHGAESTQEEVFERVKPM